MNSYRHSCRNSGLCRHTQACYDSVKWAGEPAKAGAMATLENTTFGELLRRYRLAAGLTQEELAERAALSVRGLGYLEKGARRPYRDTVRRLVEALALPTAERSAFEALARRHGGMGDGDQGLLFPAKAVALAGRSPAQDAAIPQVYISYAQPDRIIVERLIEDLERRSLTVWSEDQGLPPGTPSWEQALRDAIRAAPVVLVVVSPYTRSSRYVADELRVAELYKRPVCPVWVAGEEWMECIPLGWGGTQYLDARGDAYTAALPRIVAVVQEAEHYGEGHATQEAVTSALEVALRNPYKGLRAFGESDAGDFFGRGGLVGDLVERVGADTAPETTRFLAVVGPSGSGKSSVVLAGLLPRLRAGGVSGSAHWVYLDVLIPGVHPLVALAGVLNNALPGSSLQALHDDLDASERGLHLLARRLVMQGDDPEACVVLVVDQAEELFTLAMDEAERRHVIDLLVTAATEPGGPVLVLLTLRADFYDRPMSYMQLGRLVAAQSVAVLPMSVAEMRAAIEGPALLPDVGLRFEGELVGDLLYEVQGQPGALPLLQFTLDQLVEQRSGRLLTEAAYRALGGVRGALARHAEATYAALPSEEHRHLARGLFLRLIAPGEAEQDTTRRRVSEAELELPTAERTAQLRAVIQRFVSARLLTTTQSGGLTVLEVSHEALIREWGRLADWLHEAREDVRVQGRISTDATAWERRGRPLDSLYRGTVLAEAIGWAERNTPSALEAAFLAAAQAEGERQAATEQQRQVWELALARSAARRLRTLVGALAIFLLAAAGLAALALTTAHQAQQERQRAVTARVLSLSRQLAAQAVTHLDSQYDLALLLALEACRTANTVEARDALLRTLQTAPPGLTSFLHGHTLLVTALAMSANGKILASGGADGMIRLWDLADRRALGPPLTSHSGTVGSLAFSPGGRVLAATTSDGTVRLWDVRRRQAYAAPLRPARTFAALISLAFSPDGRTLAVGSTDRTVHFYEVARRRYRAHALITAHRFGFGFGTPGIAALAWSPNGSVIATGSLDGMVELWDARHPGLYYGRPAHTGQLRGHVGTVYGLAFSPDHKMLASVGADHTVRLWDVARQRPLGPPLRGATQATESVAFNRQGSMLASGSIDGTVRLWDARSRRPLGPPLVSHTGEVSSVVFSPDGTTLVASGSDGTIALWNVQQRQPFGALLGPHRSSVAVAGVAISPDSKTVTWVGNYSTSNGGPVQVWDLAQRKLRQAGVLTDGAVGLAFSPDGRLLAVGDTGPAGRVELRDAATAQQLSRATAPNGSQGFIQSMAVNPEGTLIATGDDYGKIQLWSVVRQPRVRVKPLGAPMVDSTIPGLGAVSGLAFSPAGRTLVSSDGTGALRLWDVAHRRPLGPPLTRQVGGIAQIAFNSDGQTVASADADSTVRLWSMARRRERTTLVGHTDAVATVAFSPDGALLASAGFDRTVRLWDVASGQPLGAPFTGFTDVVADVTFSPDGQTLAAGSADGTIRLWKINLAAWRSQACHIANRNLTQPEWRQYVGDEPYHNTCPGVP